MIAIICFIAAVFDAEMTPQQQKKTGMYKLTAKEKSALQQWIDTHYAKRSEPVEQEGEAMRSAMQENIREGTYIRLANGTLWNISPKDSNISFGWITAVDIIVTKNGEGEYPYTLTNSLTHSSVRARKVTEVEKQ